MTPANHETIERKLISELMKKTTTRCPYLIEGNIDNVFSCLSRILQDRKPDYVTEEEWGECPLLRLEALCAQNYRKCRFYQEQVLSEPRYMI